WSIQYGAEVASPWPGRSKGWRPIAAIDVQHREENHWSSDLSLRTGIEIDGVLASRKMQILFEYFLGRSPNGQFFKNKIESIGVGDPPFRRHVLTGPDLDLARLPIPSYFPGDAGRYLTAGMLVARDPATGVETEGYHRFQLKGRDRMGVSLHSRRRMFEYQRRAESKGAALPCAIVLGLHPLVSMGSLAYPPADVGKFQVVGGLLGEPLQVAPCATID